MRTTKRFLVATTWVRPVVTAVLIGWLAPAATFAQGTQGTFVGTVTDATGAVLPGVTISASGPALLVPQVSATSDAAGLYRIGELPPGLYKVTFELSGFQRVIRDELRLNAGFTARIDAQLKIGAIEESITVSGATPVVDIASTTRTQTFARETLDNVPTSKTMADILAMTPGMRTQLDVGGTNLGNLGMAGANYGVVGQGTPLIEGIDSRHRNGGGSTFFFDYQSLEEINVQAVGAGADVGQPGTAFVAIVKSGGNQFHGAYMAAGQQDWLQGSNVDDALRAQGVRDGASSFNYYYDVSGDLGGRIIRDKLWFYTAYRDTKRDTNVIGYAKEPGPDLKYGTADDVAGTYKVRIPAFSAKTTYQIDQRYKVIGFYHKDTKHEPERGGNINTPFEATFNYKFDPTIYKAEFQGVPSSRVSFNFVAGWRGYTANWLFQDGVDRPGNPRRYDRTTLLNTGPANYYYSYVGADQYTGNMSMFPNEFLGGHHEFKVGFSLVDDGTPQDYPDYASGNYRLIYDNGRPAEIETYNRPVTGVEAKQVEFAIYGQDKWQIGRLSVNMGIRYDRFHNYSPASTKPQGAFGSTGSFPQLELGTWNAFNPRLGVVYDLFGNAKAVVKGHYNRFAQRIAPDAAWDFNPNYLQTVTYRWSDPNGNNDYNPGEVNLALNGPDYLNSVGGNANILNPDLELELMHEASLSFERELMPNVGFRAMYVYKRIDNRIEVVNVARPLSAWSVPITRRDPGNDGVYNTTDDGGTVTMLDFVDAYRGSAFVKNQQLNSSSPVPYHTIELATMKRPSQGWDMMCSALLTTNNDPGRQMPSSPNDQLVYNLGENRDWVWSYKANATYRAPWQINLGAAYVGQRSLPTSRTYVFRATDTVGGTPIRNAGTITLRLDPMGSQRLAAQHVVNLRASRGFKLGSTELKLALDVYNALNANPATSQTFVAGPTFARVNEILPPRVARIGVEYRF